MVWCYSRRFASHLRDMAGPDSTYFSHISTSMRGFVGDRADFSFCHSQAIDLSLQLGRLGGGTPSGATPGPADGTPKRRAMSCMNIDGWSKPRLPGYYATSKRVCGHEEGVHNASAGEAHQCLD